jgi:hypothetical protein
VNQGLKTMNRFLISAAIIGALMTSAQAAQADTLPSIYLGLWCITSDGNDSSMTAEWPTTEEERKQCRDSDSFLIVKHNGLEGHEWGCKFVTIKHSGEMRPISTKPRKEDWVPVVRVTARCIAFDDNVEKWTTYRYEFSYVKGGYINIESKRR